MYGYYMLSAMGQQMQQYLWWKKHLTTLQIVSMMWFYFVPGIFIDKNQLLRKKSLTAGFLRIMNSQNPWLFDEFYRYFQNFQKKLLISKYTNEHFLIHFFAFLILYQLRQPHLMRLSFLSRSLIICILAFAAFCCSLA
jgi:hypothetical protein